MVHHLGLAWRSLRRTPALTAILVGGVALGVGVAMTFVGAYILVSADPIPDKSDRLFYVRMDAWEPGDPWNDERPEDPPDQLTWRDAQAAMASDIPTHASAMFKAELMVEPDVEGMRPFRAVSRLCTREFFPMFDVPFRSGSAWDAAAEAGPDQVVVIDAETNDALFGGADSVGRTLRIANREFTVVGVLDRWNPQPKFYDLTNDEFSSPESIYLPLGLVAPMRIRTAGNTNGWKPYDRSTTDGFLQSEVVWLQMWVQLDDQSHRRAYQAYLDGYARDQKALGRFQRPLNNRLSDVNAWLREQEVVPEEVSATTIIALLFLLVCSVNLIGVLLGKFLARAPEIGVRRALGASRRWVFTQHIVECELIGIAGGAIGLGLSQIGLRLQERMYAVDLDTSIDWTMFSAALGLSLLSALIAGIYPAWRICRIPPAQHLKTQ